MNNRKTIIKASALTVVSAMCASYFSTKKKSKANKPRQFAMKPKRRAEIRRKLGAHNVLALMRTEDVNRYINYLRMTPEMFDKLLSIVGPSITKSYMGPNLPISASVKLALTIRYLASGDSQMSIAHSFVLGKSTTSHIISDTLKAIWDSLHDTVLPVPTEEDWLEISRGFHERWDYPNVVGAIDGKHIRIQQPPDAGSDYYNYKGYHSTILMAICDYRYRFVCIEVGAKGRASDGGVFADSNMGRRFMENTMNLPAPTEIWQNGPKMPFTLLGDEAFGLKTWLTTPYPGKSTGKLQYSQEIYNYRQSRARRVIENTFGVMTARWRILRNSLEVSLDNSDNIVKACVCLHNYCLIEQENNLEHQKKYVYISSQCVDHEVNGVIIPGNWRKDNCELDQIRGDRAKNPTYIAKQNRDEIKEYFMEDGEVPWQWNMVP